MKKKSNRFGCFITILVISFIAFFYAKRILADILVNNNAIHTKAVIIDEQNYYPNQHVHPEFSYSYEFEVNGHKYSGNSHDKSLHIGDSVEVKYNKTFPAFNKPVHPKD
jgi:hypothetical protein